MILTSMSNPKIKQLLHLRERREREKSGTFLIEGYRELLRALEGSIAVESLFFSPHHFLGTNEESLLSAFHSRGVELFSVEKTLFTKISYRDRPDGLLAVAKKPPSTILSSLPLLSTPFYLVAEGIEKPGNLGSILRSADGAGVDRFFLCDQCTDLYNPNTIRSSVGTLFTLPSFEVSSEEMIAYLTQQNIRMISSSPKASRSFWEINGTEPLALIVGSEQLGLSQKWLDAADLLVHIPMKGKADSLNVAAATTLLLYEIVRQRVFF